MTVSSEYASLTKVPILQGTTNYTNWSMEVEAAAQLGKFWRAIQGKNSPVDTSATAKENTNNREEAALGLIKKTVIKTIALELRSFTDPNDATNTITGGTAQQLWAYLKSKYLRKEGITSFYKFGTLFRYNLIDDGTLEQQINKLSDMWSVCTTNEFELKDWQFAILVLHALPPSYRHIPKHILAASKIKDLKFTEVRAKILEAESLCNGNITTAANFLSNPKSKKKGRGPPSPCYHCGEEGHWANKCPEKPKSSNAITSPNTSGSSKPTKGSNPVAHADSDSDAPVSC